MIRLEEKRHDYVLCQIRPSSGLRTFRTRQADTSVSRKFSVENGTDEFLEMPSSVAMVRYLSFRQDHVTTDLVNGLL